MFNNNKVKDLTRENVVLKDYAKGLKQDHKEEIERLRASMNEDRRGYKKQITCLEVKNAKLTEQLSVFKENEEKYNDITVRETRVEMREAELETAGDFLSDEKNGIEKKLADAKKDAEKLVKEAETKQTERADKQYENGYADGVADGLRKVHEITAEDRKQANAVALVAAASHTPEAATEIARGLVQDSVKALGSGKK